MASFNKVLLMGNVTRDPQLKALPNGNNVAEFGLAVNRKFRTSDGEDREETCFVDCTVFGKQAEVINQYVQKGKPLFIEGRLKYEAWDDKNGGGKRSKLSVIVDNFQFLGSRDQAGDEGQRPQPARSAPQQRQPVGREKFTNRPKPEISFGDERHFGESDVPFAPARR